MSKHTPSRQRLGEVLITYRLLTRAQLDRALEIQRQDFQPLGYILLQLGYLTEERLLQACAMQKGVPPWHLNVNPPQPEALRLVPAHLCQAYQVLPVQVNSTHLTLAMKDPTDVDTIDMVRNICKLRVEPVLANEDRLAQTIAAAYDESGTTMAAVNRLVTAALDEYASDVSVDARSEGTVTEADMRPVVGLVNQILTEAVRMRASDIHVEPRKNRVEIRYRVDGQLQKVHDLPSKLQAALIARIKIMAHLDIVEYRVPQDGRIALQTEGRSVDLRVSVLPNHYGQRVVLRVLDKSAALRKLEDLGFAPHNQALFQSLIAKPYGLIVVTGPTGSGKTTTLYAAINQLKAMTNNIMTCEDPIEYDLDGINQSPVNEKVGLTFAAQLRAVLRQDPDIVLVGEIRDQETAETAIRAALTGHLVLSTIHCNDAASVVPRLTDMGIEPYLLSTALIGTTAQRLVRVLCPHCKEKATPTSEEQAIMRTHLGHEVEALWRPVGCMYCGGIGYKGRMGIHEVFPTPGDVQQAIVARESVTAMKQLARQYGYRSMQTDGCQRAAEGVTSLDEVRRLVYIETFAPVEAAPAKLQLLAA